MSLQSLKNTPHIFLWQRVLDLLLELTHSIFDQKCTRLSNQQNEGLNSKQSTSMKNIEDFLSLANKKEHQFRGRGKTAFNNNQNMINGSEFSLDWELQRTPIPQSNEFRQPVARYRLIRQKTTRRTKTVLQKLIQVFNSQTVYQYHERLSSSKTSIELGRPDNNRCEYTNNVKMGKFKKSRRNLRKASTD